MTTDDPEMVERAWILCRRLIATRTARPSTITKVTARKMARAFSQPPFSWGLNENGIEIRAMINYLRNRATPRQPIGSDGNGYWYILHPDEWDGVISHLTGRLTAIAEDLRSAKEQQEAMRLRINGLINHPLVPVLEKEFGQIELIQGGATQ